MAEVRKITIEIVEGSGGGDDGDNKVKKKKKKKTDEEILEEKKKKASEQLWHQARDVFLISVEESLQRHFTLTENYMSQNIYANAKKSISLAMSAGASILEGAKIGSVFGPGGTIGGAIVGAATFAVQQQLQYQTRMSSYYQSLNASNYQSDFSQVRAGLIDGSKGTEN